ncbi:MAG TPA: universal stress protein [Gemmatimonadaceae bacterium]|nr:universal stress protein [Gemmatimonadaceae bacterium]
MARILLATHGGPSAEGAAYVAARLSARLGRPLDAVLVLEPPPVVDAGFGPLFLPSALQDRELERRMRADALAQLALCGAGDCAPETLVGAPAPGIADRARARGAELIVVGLGPHHLADRLMGGETALRLAQTATTPVLAVPADASAAPRRVVAATDFSLTSLRAARIAASWLQPGDSLTLVSVVPGGSAGAAAVDAAARLAESAAGLGAPAGVRVDWTVRYGDSARALVDFARHSRADLITLGSHGYGPWKRLTVGSVAAAVLRVASCAVLVVPARCGTAAAGEAEGTHEAAAATATA